MGKNCQVMIMKNVQIQPLTIE
ncbi:UNVERIFIED_CONTAM: ureidoglycolate lyase, partial [Cronobacter sakazakii]